MTLCLFGKGITFAAASIAEGAVRFVGDIAMSVSDMFATETQNALESGLASTERSHALDTATIETDQLDTHSTTLVMNETTQLDGSSLIESQMSDDHSDDEPFIFLWAMNNVDDIMADTLGVGSLAPELLGVFVVCYFASLMLLRGNRSKEERGFEKPSHISVPKERLCGPHESVTHDTHNDTDSHTTITADWTMKMEKQRIRSSFLKRITRGIFFVVLSPMRLFILAACWVWSLLFNRKSILLLLYSSKCAQAAFFDSLNLWRMISYRALLFSCFQWDFWFSLGHHNIKLLLSKGMRTDVVLAIVANTDVFVLHFYITYVGNLSYLVTMMLLHR